MGPWRSAQMRIWRRAATAELNRRRAQGQGDWTRILVSGGGRDETRREGFFGDGGGGGRERAEGRRRAAPDRRPTRPPHPRLGDRSSQALHSQLLHSPTVSLSISISCRRVHCSLISSWTYLIMHVCGVGCTRLFALEEFLSFLLSRSCNDELVYIFCVGIAGIWCLSGVAF